MSSGELIYIVMYSIYRARVLSERGKIKDVEITEFNSENRKRI